MKPERRSCSFGMLVAVLATAVPLACTRPCTARADEPVTGGGEGRVSVATETAVIKFAEAHHAELATLLRHLSENAPEEYQKAVADLDRNRDRLEKLRERQPEKYEAALKEWQLTSRIRLALARMALSKDPTLEPELRDLVRERAELRLQPLRTEHERLKTRLEKVGTTLAEYDRDPAAAVDKEVASLITGNRGVRLKQVPRSKPQKPSAVLEKTQPAVGTPPPN